MRVNGMRAARSAIAVCNLKLHQTVRVKGGLRLQVTDKTGRPRTIRVDDPAACPCGRSTEHACQTTVEVCQRRLPALQANLDRLAEAA